MKWSLGILFSIVVIILALFRRNNMDGFAATSPGTMVQLRTSHVPTEEDEYYYKNIYPKIVAGEIRRMTESDLSPLAY